MTTYFNHLCSLLSQPLCRSQSPRANPLVPFCYNWRMQTAPPPPLSTGRVPAFSQPNQNVINEASCCLVFGCGDSVISS